MFSCFLKIFGSQNDKIIKKYGKVVRLINNLEDEISVLSNEELSAKTTEFKKRFANGETLDALLPEAFAVVREASKRVLGMRHFDSQLIGGMVLHDGQIAEMKTGEGKTLVATLPVYLNAISGKGVHVVTVNDYLAKRDSSWMGRVYKFLGLSVATSVSGMYDAQKKAAYAADIVYGTNHEFGFDYLRDNLKFVANDMVLRPFNFAVIDEVDSILIDEARTPLVISGSDDNASNLYVRINEAVRNIAVDDFEKDEKNRIVNLTEKGVEKIEKKLGEMGVLKTAGLYDISNISIVYHVNCALKAHQLFAKNVDYMVKNNQVMIIDEFTGRIMDGRRYSEGLHQAIEAKEGVEVQTESQTIATISYQNLFRLYPKLSGMTGTAMTEEAEFDEIYKLKVVSIPANKPVARVDHEDSIFLSHAEKEKAVVELVKECVERKQPVLVGTTSLERSEQMSALLTREGIRHNVLSAKYHEKEAYVISEAGTPGTVTIATNMAGRGTDIKLGGSFEMRTELECQGIVDEEVLNQKLQAIKEDIALKQAEVHKAGGLFVVGTERNDSRRIDNQLRGRSGRQGDPGASKYFLSLEDDLVRRFGSPNFAKTLKKIGVQKDEALTHSWISKAIAKAQRSVEASNFDIRKQLLRFDDVMNEQRKIIYEQRTEIIQAESLDYLINNMIEESIDAAIQSDTAVLEEEGKFESLNVLCSSIFNTYIETSVMQKDFALSPETLHDNIEEKIKHLYHAKVSQYDKALVCSVEKEISLKIIDTVWRNHLISLEHLRRGINLSAYAQKNPLNEYKFEAFNLFQNMLANIRMEILTDIFHFNFDTIDPAYGNHIEESKFDKLLEALTREVQKNQRAIGQTVNRNALCSCGSGQKYKHCHGKIEDITPNDLVDFLQTQNGAQNEAIQEQEIADVSTPVTALSENQMASSEQQTQMPKDGDFDDIEHYQCDEDGVLKDFDPSNIRLSNADNAVSREKNEEQKVDADDLSSALDDINISELIDTSKIGSDDIGEYLNSKDKKKNKTES